MCMYYCLQLHAVVGVLLDDTDPMVSVMKLEKAPQESYADIGGLDTQIQEIKVSNTSTDKVVWNQSCVRDTSVLQLGLFVKRNIS